MMLKVWAWYDAGSSEISSYFLNISALIRASNEREVGNGHKPLNWTKVSEDYWDGRNGYDVAFAVYIDESE